MGNSQDTVLASMRPILRRLLGAEEPGTFFSLRFCLCNVIRPGTL